MKYAPTTGFTSDTDGLWEYLVDYAKANAQLDLLLAVQPSDLERFGASRVTQGLVELAEEQPSRWDAVMAWLESTAHTGSDSAKWSVADVLMDSTRSRVPDTELLRTIRLAEWLLETQGHPLAQPLAARSGDLEAPYDLGHQQLNAPGGKAAEALRYALDRTRFNASDSGVGRLADWAVDDIRKAAEQGWGGIQMRVMIGEVFPVIVYAEPDLSSEILPGLLPSEQHNDRARNARRAFWTGYVMGSGAFDAALVLLRDSFRKEIENAGADDSVPAGLLEQMLQHVVVACVRGLDGFAEIVDQTLGSADPTIRRQVARTFARFLGAINESPDVMGRIRTLALDYWAKHAAADPIGTESFEEYVVWLLDLKSVPLQHLEKHLLHVVSASSVKQRTGLVLDYLKEHREEDPELAVKLVSTLVERSTQDIVYWTSQALADVLEALSKTSVWNTNEFRQLVNRSFDLGMINLEQATRARRVI